DGWSVINNGHYNELELFQNGNTLPYQTIHRLLLEALRKHQFTEQELEQLLKTNPVNCFALSAN
ncbi:MAG: hypothetical protein EAZ17_01675, partial [Sphingobacteriales bacterium]